MRKRKKLQWDTDCKPVTPAFIAKVGNSMGIAFPMSYVQCASKYHGGSPNLECFDLPDRPECVLANLLSFDDEDNITEHYQTIKKRLPEHIVPFAVDPFGNSICFDYRTNKNSPSVVFWDHERTTKSEASLTFICDSFDAFLELLYNPE